MGMFLIGVCGIRVVIDRDMQGWMAGVTALGTATSCDLKMESSGPEIGDTFSLVRDLLTRRKVEENSR